MASCRMVAMTAAEDQLIDWLLEGDPSIRWRVYRDLLGSSESTVRDERAKVANEGWGAKLISLQDQLTKKVRKELPLALGTTSGSADATSVPANPEAYDLYLRSVPVAHDPKPNKEGIVMLERAVGMDPSYAPAWEALGRRYYFDAIYSGGGEQGYNRSSAAYERALALEPDRV